MILFPITIKHVRSYVLRLPSNLILFMHGSKVFVQHTFCHKTDLNVLDVLFRHLF